ncbi:MAG: BREX-1 system adenine-specific DNA-methyltransferase PglX, partial [Acetobacterium sp.]|nr:BREX-1 system adenine-specific DNA-methyltransferase PglX [Acetobacterium sp.]
MNKTAIKNFAIWARNKLIADITYKAGLLGITEKEIKSPLPQSTKDVQFFDIGTKEPYSITGVEIKQRRKLVEIIQQKERQSDYQTAYNNVVEEVAYTWFNRLIAVRFMEVNDYLPSRVRALSSESGTKIEPDLVTSPFDADLQYTPYEKDRIMQLKNDNKLDELFCMLFIKQCNALNAILPELFEKTNDYTELLMNVSFTDKDGVVYHLVHDIPEDDFNVVKEGQVEIIGWLYQYYNTEVFNMLFDGDMARHPISSDYLPAATQMFTPDWVVRNMVENSLGRLWLEGHPNDDLKAKWNYYLDEAKQGANVQKQLDAIREEYKKIKPEDIKIIDPCMGSGHILVYAFDVLMQIYESYGYSQRDAAKSIVENNLYGLDIDNRAYQLAYFAVLMKARQYNRRILNGEIQCHIYTIQESNDINCLHLEYFGFGMSDSEKKNALSQTQKILDTMWDAKEYGSILNVEQMDWDLLYRFVRNVSYDSQITLDEIGLEETQLKIIQLIEIDYAMTQKYDITITNPPYLNSSRMSSKLTKYVKDNYEEAKADLSSVMYFAVIKNLLRQNGFVSFVTTNSWMFLRSFEKIRQYCLANTSFEVIVDYGTELFDGKIGHLPIISWVSRKCNIAKVVTSIRLVEYCYSKRYEKMSQYFNLENYYRVNQEEFNLISGSPIVYWISKPSARNFRDAKTLLSYARPRVGQNTGDNERFLRQWFEIDIHKKGTRITHQELATTDKKWIPYNKGGNFRRWYGNFDYVVNWAYDGKEIKDYAVIRNKGKHWSRYIQNIENLCKEGVSWSDIATTRFGCRYLPQGFICDVKGSSMFPSDEYRFYLLAFLNSKIAISYLQMLNPSTTFQVGNIGALPLIISDLKRVSCITKDNISLSQEDWDSFETSWDFSIHPFLRDKSETSIETAFNKWKQRTDKLFECLKENEITLNQIFIAAYGLQDEMTPFIDDKDVTIRKADLSQDIRSFISYAVGCVFGRYSLDVDGLAYAGGEWDDSKYSTFIPDKDNILPITDEEYFEDDVIGLFCAFLKKTFGMETLEENLDFIANALGNRGNSSREIIRNYFLKDFFKDHCQIYQKRPIYWLFDSGKADGFKALIYLHR